MKRIFFTLLFLCFFFPVFLSAKVWINELMQSNIDLVRDDLQDFPDSWIELYNDSDEAVNIQNWTISDVSNYQNGWKIIDSVVIEPQSYLLIYADKASTGLHTHFRLESGNNGAVYLFDASGNQIDAVRNIPKQPAPNVNYGRIRDGGTTWMHFVTATPGSANTGKTSIVVLPPPVFSQPGGIFKDTVIVNLSLPANTPNGVVLSDIHYTLDNSEPTLDSPVYTEELEIPRTTVVRAKLIHPNYLADRSTVHTYIISKNDFPLPVISISTDFTYLWDEEFGIYCEGNGKYGVIGNCIDYPANWNNNWRRPINFEYFPLGSNTSVLNQLCEMRIAGGCSRQNPQKPLIVYGHKRFGINRFYYDLFEEKPNQEIKSFMIRNSGNDFRATYFRDAAIQLFMGGKVNIDYQAYQPTIFYLNGVYWGIQNLRERSDEDFVLANYGLADTEIDVIENWIGELKAGDLTAWNQLMSELQKPSSTIDYEWIMNQIDIDEFINYMILQIYVANTDFPDNNVVMWRPRTANGKWRFILKDLDFGLNLYGLTPPSYNAMEYNTSNDNDDRKLFNALLTQDSFRKKFYSRFAIYMGDLLHYNSTSQVIDSIQQLLEPAMLDHILRWISKEGEENFNHWYDLVSLMKTWCNERNVEVYKHLQDFFQLGTIMQLTVSPIDNLAGTPSVFINDVRIRDSGLDASYFQNETIKLHYEGDTQYVWKIVQFDNRTRTIKYYYQQDLSYPIVEGCTYVKISLIKNDLNALTELTPPEIGFFVFDNYLQITDLEFSSVISIYDISGRLVAQTTTANRSINIPFHRKGIFIVKVQNEAQQFIKKVIKM